jgi:glycolate oxidase iron-sulfur subunit
MNEKKSLLQQARKIASECDRCGACLTVCPLFGEKDIESSCARGKNNLTLALAQGVLKPSPELLNAVNFCLLCRTCVDNCPTKVQTDEAMIAVRQHLFDEFGGASLRHKALGGLMKSRFLVKISSRAMKVMRKLGINKLVPFGLVPDELTEKQYMALFAGPAALGTPPEASSAALTARTRVAYFNGCGMQMMFPDAAEKTRQLLAEVSTTKPQPVDNLCCGLMHLAHGLREDFLAMAKENIKLYENADVIVTDCASCSSTLKHTGRYFLDDPEWKDRAEAFSKKIMDITEYLVKAGYKPKLKRDVTLTFHEPCHLGRGQGLRTQPRELLKAAGNYVEMKGADTCCGGAGSFHIDYPEIADGMLEKKRKNIEQTGAVIVVSECPACLTQMNKAAQRSGGKFKVMHISQVL